MPTRRAINAPAINPNPQFSTPIVVATTHTIITACIGDRGHDDNAPSNRSIGGDDANACPVTRIRHICIPNDKNFHNPSGPDHAPIASSTPIGVHTSTNTNVKAVSKIAKTNGSGAVARNTPAIRSPIRASIAPSYSIPWPRYHPPTMFGSHLSIAGSLVNALDEAQSLKLETVQIFTKNQRQWRFTPLNQDDTNNWLDTLSQFGWQHRTVAHDSYLINLASPDDELWNKSIALMHEEISRAQQLSIRYLVSHPGAFTTSTTKQGINRIALAYKKIFKAIPFDPDTGTILCLENTAGGGSTLGRSLEELADIRTQILDAAGKNTSNRVGYCIDTCHAFAAGYDIRTPQGGEQFLDDFDRICGIENLKVLHLNDSLGDLASHRDRHAHIGKGLLGLEGFRTFVNDPRLAGIPKILETPKGTTPNNTPYDTLNLRRLRRLMR